MTIRFVLVLLIVKQILGTTTISVALTDSRINSITNYTWIISFGDSIPRTFMIFTFPTAVATTPTSTSYYLGTQYTPTSIGANSITIPTTGLTIVSSMTFIITNIVNPSSALTSVRTFYFSSSQETNIILDLISSINYIPGSLSSCTWTFNKCTQQLNSLLTINITTANRIPSGNQIISVGFPAVWANHYNKSPVSGISASSLTCSISFNGGTVVSSGVTCTFTSNTIRVSYSIITQLNASSLIAIYILGVNSPPTVNTQFSTQYTTKTADAGGNTIDGIATGSGCTITPVCVTNYSIATFTPTSLPINTITTNLKTTFNFFPTITFINSDAVQISYTQPSSLVSCSTFRVLRNVNVYDLLNNSTGSLMSYYFSSTTTLPNIEYSYSISVYFLCTSITLPKSEEPTTFIYKFKRNGDEYLELTATLTATAVAFNSINASLALTTNQMGATATTYTFSFSNGQGLGSTPSIVLQFPSDIPLTGVTCMMGVNGTPTSSPCISVATSLTINYSGAGTIANGSNIIIKVIGITNPLSPATRTFGIITYYNSSVNTSRVQYNTAAFNASYSAITNIGIALTPSTYTVYTLTPANITFISPLVIPAFSTFLLTFPSDVSQISSTSQGLMINNSYALLNATPTTTGSSLTFYNAQEIPLGSSLTIILTFRSPTYVKTFSYVQLVISNGNTAYIQSLSTMVIQVTSTGVMPVSISPLTSLTGAISSYQITLTLTIPHPSLFTMVVDVASDTTFNGVGATCTGVCTSLTPNGNSTISLSINNPSPNSTSPINIIFTINSFTNPRSVGTGALWNISTKTSALDPISFQSASPLISVPNLLTGALEPGEYYRNNTNIVKLKINFTNLLFSTDYLLFSMDKTTYTVNSNVSCSSLYGTCWVYNATTNNVLVLKVIPNSNNLYANPLQLWIEGLISGANTFYLDTSYIVVGSYNSNDKMIDQGRIPYSISCGDTLSLPNNCRTCSSSGACISCYVSQGYYLNGTMCVTSCGGATSYMFYGNSTSGTCQSCTTATNGCLTCSNQTACMSCLNSSYYLYTNTLICSIFCSNTSGYKDTVISGIRVCVPCADPNCLVCTNTSYGTCTQCSPSSILVSGICSNNCPSLSYYVLNMNCVPCDPACYNCTSGGDRSCIVCQAGYYNFSGVCTTTCPTGTAKIISNATCGCYSACLTCDSINYANCTICLNSSLLLYNGQCVSSCPTSTYLLNTNCVACSSGCLNCTSSVCFTCSTGLYMLNSKCYGDCNAISPQYDISNSTCVLCPTGCDTCSNGACSSCLSDYSLLSATCIKTCLLTNSCQIDTSNVLPLPGTLSVAIWCIVVLIIRYFSHSNYVPYSMILLSSLVQFCLILAILSQASSAVVISRLLAMDMMSKNAILILLGFTLALNYITNIIYLYIFVKYLKPLLTNPKQIDVITNVVTLLIAVLTNYRFAIVAFSKMFPKPRIHIQMAKNLTPVHYICFVSLILSIFPVVGCTILLSKQQKLTTLYMLALDLMIIIIFNAIITIWFISSKKDEVYFDDQLKKQYASEDINVTKENIKEKQEKDDSNVNMIASIHNSQKDGHQSDQYDFGESYKKFKAKKTQIKANNNNNSTNDPILIDDLPQKSNIQRRGQIKPKKSQERNVFAIENEYEAEIEQPHNADVNYEDIILSRKNKLNLDKKSQNKIPSNKDINNKMSRATTINRNYGSRQERRMDRSREMDLDSQKFDKQFHPMHKNERGLKQISDIENGSYIDMQDSFNKLDQQAVQINLQLKEKLPRPKRINNNRTSMDNKPIVKDTKDNKTAMRKVPNKKYFQSDATFDEKQKDTHDDLSAIIKNKVHESSIRKSQNISILTHEENDLEQISPSYYNFQNQRFHLQDVQASSNQS